MSTVLDMCFCCHHSLSFHSLDNAVCRARVFSFDEIQFYYFFSFMDHIFCVMSKNSSPSNRSGKFSPMCSSKSFAVLHFAFESMIIWT